MNDESRARTGGLLSVTPMGFMPLGLADEMRVGARLAAHGAGLGRRGAVGARELDVVATRVQFHPLGA